MNLDRDLDDLCRDARIACSASTLAGILFAAALGLLCAGVALLYAVLS